jgi:hypothetical protein
MFPLLLAIMALFMNEKKVEALEVSDRRVNTR